uniref:Zinc finger, CCHC-type, retrotransposon Gag domain protein n=1 Tax=Tanacetum cinerariifolium TaxID=118510 RepID=A0A699RRY9_TANCI|nr:zinc finger, CCHC-type, retrotransposon Gag domain protein [Tanacetum cinerariifolium]
MNTKTSMEFMQRFFRIAGFIEVAAGTEEEQAKNFQWGLRSNNRLNFKSIQSSSTHERDPNITAFDYGRDQRNRGQQSNRSAISGNSS